MKSRNRIKIILFVLFSIWNIHSFAQTQPAKDTIIYLQEVVITNKKTTIKNIEVKTKGSGNIVRGFQNTKTEFVSLVKDIPTGHLKYISFYFDTKQMIQKTTYELGLLIYDVDENGKPGNELFKNDVRFFLKAKGKGKIKLNISDLDLNAQENLFLGFEILDDIYQRPLLVEFVEGKQSVSYYKEINDIWRSPVNDVPYQLKLQIDVAPF